MLATTFVSLSAFARESVDVHSGKTSNQANIAATLAACTRAQARTVFELNNVRTILLTAGDMWWAAANNAPQYEIPKGGGAHSLFAGALWIGGIDDGGNLKVAAMTYRQGGDDFWPGTIDTANLQTEANRCTYYDKHFRITRKEVEEYIGWVRNEADYPGYVVPESIKKWPAYGNDENQAWTNETKSLAPFHDDGDGIYTVHLTSPNNPNENFDYPNYNVTNTISCDKNYLFGDETLWWVFNDVGNIHTETNGAQIGLEIQAQAFAFQTNDEINNMTFYKYKISNHSQQTLDSTFFGQWVDSDLGGAKDDFVGCDVGRGLGYIYNGDNLDLDFNGSKGYGDELPAMGIDFFEGPFVNQGGTQDLPKTVQNPASANGFGYGDGFPGNERAGMSKFVFYNNGGGLKGDPHSAVEYYNYCSGSWIDGTPFTYGGAAKGGTQKCSYMYPGSSDPLGFGTKGNITNATWSEVNTYDGSPPATPNDRRFFQSAGPFQLKPGAVNYVTVGAVWARAPKGAPATDAIALLQAADKKAQNLFDNCFKVLDGPDSPDLTIQEIDKELLVYITNKPSSNNYLEKYKEKDPSIVEPSYTDTTYKFEGYQIFQLKDASVSSTDLYDINKARLVKQMDLKNNFSQLVNFDDDPSLGANVNVPMEMVNGENNGIVHSFRITEDLFAQGNKTLVNHKQYYYMALAYGVNMYKKYDQSSGSGLDGQKKPYKQGRKNLKAYTGIPHIPSPEASGTIANSAYGYGPKLRRIEGQGNGGQLLELTSTTISRIMSSATFRDSLPEYENAKGPVNIKVIDPLNVPAADFTFYMLDTISAIPANALELDDAHWMLKNNTSGEIVYSGSNIKIEDEAIITKWGLSVSLKQMPHPVDSTELNGGFIAASIHFADESQKWLTGVVDDDSYTTRNWIRSGINTSTLVGLKSFNDWEHLDDDQIYEKVVGGTWAPYVLTYKSDAYDPAANGSPYAKGGLNTGYQGFSSLKYLSSVDVVFTSDKSLWTRCPVLEMCDDPALAEGNAPKFTHRRSPSVNAYGQAGISGSSDLLNSNLTDAEGMGWFPGYAINVETGERLNMAFGEDSYLTDGNGRDMMWNPTATEYAGSTNYPYFGGRHYIYIFNHLEDPSTPQYTQYMAAFPRYDKGKYFMGIYPSQSLRNIDNQSNTGLQATLWRACIWTSIPLLADGFESLSKPGETTTIPNEAKVRLRVNKPYQRGFSTQYRSSPLAHALKDLVSGTAQNNDRPMYTFSTMDLQTQVSDADEAKKALDLINVVPNPYYAYSSYENTKLENTIKITNLPEKCTIKIYTLNGTLIKSFNIDQPATARNTMGVAVTSQNWDLNNQAGIPIASGLYIIHVDVPGVGEKTLKWFGVMRPIDLESY